MGRIDKVKDNIAKMSAVKAKDRPRTEKQIAEDIKIALKCLKARDTVDKWIEEAGGITEFIDQLVGEQYSKEGPLKRGKWDFNEDAFVRREVFRNMTPEQEKAYYKDRFGIDFVPDKDHKVGENSMKKVFEKRKKAHGEYVEKMRYKGLDMCNLDYGKNGEILDITDEINGIKE